MTRDPFDDFDVDAYNANVGGSGQGGSSFDDFDVDAYNANVGKPEPATVPAASDHSTPLSSKDGDEGEVVPTVVGGNEPSQDGAVKHTAETGERLDEIRSDRGTAYEHEKRTAPDKTQKASAGVEYGRIALETAKGAGEGLIQGIGEGTQNVIHGGIDFVGSVLNSIGRGLGGKPTFRQVAGTDARTGKPTMWAVRRAPHKGETEDGKDERDAPRRWLDGIGDAIIDYAEGLKKRNDERFHASDEFFSNLAGDIMPIVATGGLATPTLVANGYADNYDNLYKQARESGKSHEEADRIASTGGVINAAIMGVVAKGPLKTWVGKRFGQNVARAIGKSVMDGEANSMSGIVRSGTKWLFKNTVKDVGVSTVESGLLFGGQAAFNEGASEYARDEDIDPMKITMAGYEGAKSGVAMSLAMGGVQLIGQRAQYRRDVEDAAWKRTKSPRGATFNAMWFNEGTADLLQAERDGTLKSGKRFRDLKDRSGLPSGMTAKEAETYAKALRSLGFTEENLRFFRRDKENYKRLGLREGDVSGVPMPDNPDVTLPPEAGASELMTRELRSRGIEPVKFTVPSEIGADGRPVPRFTKVKVKDNYGGVNGVFNIAIDENAKVAIIDNGDGTYTAYDSYRNSETADSIDEAIEKAQMLALIQQVQNSDRQVKERVIRTEAEKYGYWDTLYYPTMEDAADAIDGLIAANGGSWNGLTDTGFLRTPDKAGRDAFYVSDNRSGGKRHGVAFLILDNIKGVEDIPRILGHEHVGHGGPNAEFGGSGGAVKFAENVRAKEFDAFKKDVVAGVRSEVRARDMEAVNRNLGEVFAHYAAANLDREPSKLDRLVSAVNSAARKLKLRKTYSAADVKTMMARWKAAGRGEGGVVEGRADVPERFEFFPVEERKTTTEVKDETGNVRDEAPAQPEQGASEPAGGEAARPVEAQPQGGEAPRQGAVEPAKTGSDAAEAPTEAPTAMKTEHDFLRVMHDNQKPVRVPVGEISLPDTQFKEGADPKTGVVKGQELKGEYFESAENAVVVYVRKDGTKELVTGRHRVDLAKRNGKNDILARVFREADGYTPEDMRNLDAISNIIDEKGTEHDYIRYFENAKPSRAAAEAAGFLSRSKGRLAFELYEGATEGTRAAIDWSGSGADGLISPEQAGIIAKAAPRDANPRNGAVQRILVRKALDGLKGDRLAILARSLAEEAKRRKAPAADGGMQLDLFTSEEDLQLLALEEKRAAKRVEKANEYGRVAGVLQTAMQNGGRLDLNKAYARELGIRNPKDRKQLAAARQKALERADYWRNAVRLDEADRTALDAELGIAPKENLELERVTGDRIAEEGRARARIKASDTQTLILEDAKTFGETQGLIEEELLSRGYVRNRVQMPNGTFRYRWHPKGAKVTGWLKKPAGDTEVHTAGEAETIGVKPSVKAATGGAEKTKATTGGGSAADAAYRAWLGKYGLKDTAARRVEFDRKVEKGDVRIPEAEKTAAKKAESPDSGEKITPSAKKGAPKTLMAGGVPIEDARRKVTVTTTDGNGRPVTRRVTPEEAEAMGMVMSATAADAAKPAPRAADAGRDARKVAGTDYTVARARELLREDVEARIADAAEEWGTDLRVVGVDLHGSRVRGDARPDSDLDLVVEYEGDAREDDLFDALNADPIDFHGIRVDVNPIRADKTGTLAEYMARSDGYDREKLAAKPAPKPAAPKPKVKTPSVRMKDEAAERKAKAALDAIDFDTPELDGLKSKIRNGTILTEADQRQFAEDVRKGRMRYPRFRADEIAASTGKEHGKLWQYILSLESARMDGRRARGGSEVYGRAASQVRRGGSEWGRVGTGSAQSPSVAYSQKYRKLDSGTESEVFDTGDGWVVKVRQIHPLSIGDVIDELAKVVYHNYLFPGEKYVLDDIVRHEHDGYREFYLILRQPFVTPKTENGRIVQPTYAQIWQLMKSRPQGFTFLDLSSRPAETGEYGDYSSSDGDEGEVVPAVKKVAYNRQFVVYDFQPGRNTFIDAKSGKVRFIDPRIDINDPGAGFRYSKYGTRRKFDGEVDFDTPELGVGSTIVSGDEVRKTMPGYNRLDWSTHVDRTGYVGPRLEAQFRRLLKERKGKGDGTVVFLAGGNGAGKSTVAAKIGNSHDFTIDSTLGNLEVAKKQIDAILANGQTPEIHFVYRTTGQALEGIAQRVKNGGHIVSPLSFANSHVKSRENLRLLSEAYGDKIHLHIYDNSVDGAPEITLKQLEAKGKPGHERIRESANYYLGHLREREEARSRSQGGVAGGGAKGEASQVDFDTPDFDPERFGKLVTGVGKLVDVLVESGHRDFKALATYIYERDAAKYGRAKPVLQDIWNAVARARGLSRVGDAEAERVFGIIEAQDKEAEDAAKVEEGLRQNLSMLKDLARIVDEAAPKVVKSMTDAQLAATLADTRFDALDAADRKLVLDEAAKRGITPPAGREEAAGRGKMRPSAETRSSAVSGASDGATWRDASGKERKWPGFVPPSSLAPKEGLYVAVQSGDGAVLIGKVAKVTEGGVELQPQDDEAARTFPLDAVVGVRDPASPARRRSVARPAGEVDFYTPGLYTGSAADYEKPSLHYVGTGEGTQVYGWGLYASNQRGVAEGYARPNHLTPEGLASRTLHQYSNDRDAAIAHLQKYVDSGRLSFRALTKEEIARTKGAIEILKSHAEKSGHLYEQTFFTNRAPGDESHLLKWYEMDNLKPGNLLHEQLKWIRRQAKSEGVKLPRDLGSYGMDVYETVANALGSPKAASEFLARAGIDGVKYPVDSYGKAVKDGDAAGWNYVSFRDDNIRVDHKWTDGEIQFDTPELSPEGWREHDAVVARYMNADGTKKPGWMKAPNGEPTKLTERQWAQVRTPSFKKWFGDWERLAELHAARDFALNSEPVAEVSGNDFQKDPTGANTLIDRVADYFAELGGKAESPDLGTVELTRRGVKSSVAHGIGAKKAAAFAAVKDVIEKGVVFDRNDDWKGRGYATAAIAAPIRMGGKDYVCELIVNRYKDRNAFYLHEVNLKEKLSNTIKTATGAVSIGESARPVMSIIAQRLAEVNPASVSKVVDENGEPLVVYHGHVDDFTVFKPSERGKLGKGVYLSAYKEKAGRYSRIKGKFGYGHEKVMSLFVNIRNPYVGSGERYDEGLRNALTDNSYDGIISDKNMVEIVARNPAQVKSATGNNGDFSRTKADINFDTPELAAESHSRSALADIAAGKPYGILHNPKYGVIRYPLGRAGKGGEGFLHIVEHRMNGGASLDDAIDVAIKVGKAAEIGEETLSRYNTHHLDSNGVRAIIAEMPDHTKVITGYEIDADEKAAANRRAAELAPPPHVSSEEVIAHLREIVSQSAAGRNGVSAADDAAYMDAVRRGDMETARRLLKAAWERSGYSPDTSYKDAHAAPSAPVEAKDFKNVEALNEARDEGWDLNLWAIANGITGQPDDFFSERGPSLYGYDDAAGREAQRAVAQAIGDIRGGNDKTRVIVYRAVPNDVKLDGLQSGGQWVSPSKTYAENHGKSRFGDGAYRIVREVVRAENLWWDGNDAREWGYDDGRQYVYRNAENGMKLATVTYDDAGNVIPLSQRFDPSKGDVNFDSPELDPMRRAEEVNTYARRYYERHKALHALERPTRESVMDAAEGRWQKLRRALQDKNLVIREVEERLGVTDKKQSVYYAKDREFGLNEHQLGELQRRRVEPIFDALADVGVGQEAFDLYLIARHAPYRNALVRGRNGAENGSGMSDADADAVIGRFRALGVEGELARIADMVYDMNDEALQRLVDSGRLSQEDADGFRAAQADYVPLRTDMEDADRDAFNTSTSGWKKNEFHAAKGRNTLADSPLAWSIVQAERAIKASNANVTRQAAAALVRHAEKIGKPIGEIVPAHRFNKRWAFDIGGEVWTADALKDRPDLIFFKEDGRLKAIKVDGGKNALGITFAKAVTDKDVVRFNEKLNLINKIVRLLSAMRTQFVPTFILRNLKADTMEVLPNMIGERGAKEAIKFMGRKLVNQFRDLKDVAAYFRTGEARGWMKEFVENGGLTGGGMSAEGFSEATRRIETMLKASRGGTGKKVVMSLAKVIPFLNELSEYSTRLGVYSTLRKEGVGVEDAISYARDITVNFNRKGEWTPITNAAFMFSNARLQGQSRFLSSLRGEHGWQVAVYGLLVGVIGFYLKRLFGNDDDRERAGQSNARNISDHEKLNNIIIPLPGGTYFKWQNRSPINTLSFIAEKSLEALYGETTAEKAAVAVIKALADEAAAFFGGPGFDSAQTAIPTQIGRTYYQWKVGVDFKDDPRLRRKWNENLPDSWNGKANTPEPFKWFSKTLNWATGGSQYRKGWLDTSPENWQLLVDYLLGGVGTDIGRVATTVQNMVLAAHGAKPDQVLRDVPFVRDTVTNMPDVSRRYYESFDEYDADRTEFRGVRGADGRLAFAARHPWVMDDRVKRLDKEIRELGKMEQGLEKKGGEWVAAERTPKERLEFRRKRLAKMAEFVGIMEEKPSGRLPDDAEYRILTQAFSDAKKEYETIQKDPLVETKHKKSILDEMRGSNPLLADKVRWAVDAHVKAVNKLESELKSYREKGAPEKNLKDAETNLRNLKDNVLKLIQENRRAK